MKLNNFVGLLQMNKKLIILIATIIPLIIVLSFYLYFKNSPKRKIIKFQKNVEELLKENKFDLIYTCGPEIMMKGIIKLSLENNIKCFASLERRMACGVNACLGCNIEILENENTKNIKKNKYILKKVCHDGPVFDAKYLMV